MPGWGSGSFDNDDAQFFLRRLPAIEIGDLTALLTLAADQSDYLGVPESSAVVVAAEIVAAARGTPSVTLPLQITEWLGRVEGAPSAATCDLACRALARIRTSSELKDLWQEADGLNDWSAALHELEGRLADS